MTCGRVREITTGSHSPVRCRLKLVNSSQCSSQSANTTKAKMKGQQPCPFHTTSLLLQIHTCFGGSSNGSINVNWKKPSAAEPTYDFPDGSSVLPGKFLSVLIVKHLANTEINIPHKTQHASLENSVDWIAPSLPPNTATWSISLQQVLFPANSTFIPAQPLSPLWLPPFPPEVAALHRLSLPEPNYCANLRSQISIKDTINTPPGVH